MQNKLTQEANARAQSRQELAQQLEAAKSELELQL